MSAPPKRTRSETSELVTAAALVVALPLGFDLLGRVIPWIGANLLLFVAATFLWLPAWTLPKKGPHPNDYGVDTGRLADGLRWAAALTLVTLVGFVPGFHIWNTYALGEQPELDTGAFFHAPDRAQGRPARFDTGNVYVFAEDDLIHVRAEYPDQVTQIVVESSGRIRTFSDTEYREALSSRSDRVARMTVVARDASDVHIRVIVDGTPVSLDAFRLGAGARPPPERLRDGEALTLPLSLWWLPSLIAIQLLLIAFPEEYFFRGYLQRRQDELLGESRRVYVLGPIFQTRAIVLSSLVFALVHFVIGFSPIRLAVFFPSLLFGFLRDRTDNLVAPVIFHTACNLMVHIAAQFYVPG